MCRSVKSNLDQIHRDEASFSTVKSYGEGAPSGQRCGTCDLLPESVQGTFKVTLRPIVAVLVAGIR